jgi:hypothetical protein
MHGLCRAEISIDLNGGANNKFGELKIWVASSLASTREAVQDVNQAAEHLDSGLGIVNEAIQATTPLATEITAQFNAWQPLLSRLGALVKVADMLAEVRFIPNHPCSTTKHLQTGSPLDQAGMGNCLSSL